MLVFFSGVEGVKGVGVELGGFAKTWPSAGGQGVSRRPVSSLLGTWDFRYFPRTPHGYSRRVRGAFTNPASHGVEMPSSDAACSLGVRRAGVTEPSNICNNVCFFGHAGEWETVAPALDLARKKARSNLMPSAPLGRAQGALG